MGEEIVNALKFGASIVAAVLLAGVTVSQAQQSQQSQQSQQTQQAQQAQQAQQTQHSPQAAETPVAASSAAAPAGKPTAAAASPAKASSDTQAADSGLSVAQLKEARDDGYRPITRGSATLYCKSEIIVGSSFPVHTCYNADRLKAVLQQYQTERMQLQQMHNGGMQGH
jgi:type II secretory pathway pseudopilin PulG